MATENSLITLLQTPTLVENPASSQIKNNGEESQFKNILEEASEKINQSEKSTSTRKDKHDEQTLPNNQHKTDKSSSKADSSKRAGGNQELDKNEETFESGLKSVNQDVNSTDLNNQKISQDRANSSVDSQGALEENLKSFGLNQEKVEKLKTLGIDQEQINAFLGLMEVDVSSDSAEELILNLAVQLNLKQSEEFKNSLTNLKGVGKLNSLTNMRDSLGADFLHKSGLSDVEAKSLFQTLSKTKTDGIKAQETLAQNIKKIETESIARQIATTIQSPKDIAQTTHAQAREAGRKMADKLINKQRLDYQKLSSQEQAEKTDGLSTERIKTKNSVGKPFSLSQIRQEASIDKKNQTILLNSLNLKNSKETFSPFDYGPSKVSVESLFQNSYQSVEKLSGQIDALSQTAKEAPLPRGVTESKVIDQIVRKFSVRGTGAKNEVHIRLEPPSLGTVRMNISTANDIMKTTVIAENHAVRQAIESNLSQLKDALSQQGVTLESFDVMVGGDASFKGQNQQEPGKERSKEFALNDFLNEETLELAHLENSPPSYLGDGTISLFA